MIMGRSGRKFPRRLTGNLALLFSHVAQTIAVVFFWFFCTGVWPNITSSSGFFWQRIR